MTAITPFHSAPVNVGPGILFVAPLGTTAPLGIHGGPDATQTPGTNGVAFGAGWVPLGYTVNGSEFDYTPTVSGIAVAESLTDLKQAITKVVQMIKFEMAEVTAANVQLALNAGAGLITTPVSPIIHTQITLATPGLEPRVMLGWDRADGLERMIFYQVLQTGALKVSRQKAPNLSSLPVEFTLEVPPTGNPVDWRLGTSITHGTGI